MPKEVLDTLEKISDDNIADVKAVDIPVLAVFCALFTVVALQFFTRYVLNDSLGWTEEIARYLLVLLGFVGSITCVRKGKHIFLGFAYRYFPVRSIKPILVLVEVTSAGFWGYVGWLAIELATKTRSNMVSFEVPKAYLYHIVAASCLVMVVFAVVRLRHRLRQSPETAAREVLHTQ